MRIILTIPLFFICLYYSAQVVAKPKETNSNKPQSSVLELFKSTAISDKKKIELQANISSLNEVIVKDGKQSYHLKKGSYSVADSICIEVNADQKISGIYYFYDYAPEYSNDTAYIHEQRKYQSMMSSPGKEAQANFANGSVKVTKWQSENVIFQLIEVNNNGVKKTYSTVLDRKLYTKKIDLKKKASSIASLKKIGLFI